MPDSANIQPAVVADQCCNHVSIASLMPSGNGTIKTSNEKGKASMRIMAPPKNKKPAPVTHKTKARMVRTRLSATVEPGFRKCPDRAAKPPAKNTAAHFLSCNETAG